MPGEELSAPKLTPQRRLFRLALLGFLRRTVRTIVDYQVEGYDRIPTEGPLLVIMNHLGLMDVPLLAFSFPRMLDGIVADQVFQVPVIGTLLRWYGAIPVKRGRFDRNVIRQALAVLQNGRALALAPEAGVSDSGALLQAQMGAAYLATEARAPILPAAITGTESVHAIWDEVSKKMNWRGVENLNSWRSGSRRLLLKLTFGQPFTIETAEQSWREKRETLRQTTDQMMVRLAALLPPPYRGVYDEKVI